MTAVVLGLPLTPACADSPARASGEVPGVATATLVNQLRIDYRDAFLSHNSLLAARARGMAAAGRTLATQAPATRRGSAERTASRLQRELAPTAVRLQVWPLPEQVDALATRLGRELDGSTATRGTLPVQASGAPRPEAATSEVERLTQAAGHDAADHRIASARAALAQAYAVFATELVPRLETVAPELVGATEADMWPRFPPHHEPEPGTANSPSSVADSLSNVVDRVQGDLGYDAAALGQVQVSRATIVSDAAIILFREGLEAVLILAAITASFTGSRRRLRRPVLVGAGLGLAATAMTYVLAQVLIDALGDGGLRLQAITGLLAIVVLLVVTNWFFHRVYWSEWIARFNRRRRSLERVEQFGFISGQTLGFLLLGLTSVYREGFETVLFLQNLQVSAGTGATLLGVAIGLGATLVVGFVTFALGRKLPYKRMLIVTGVLIGLVLAVMVGTTVNNLQGLGWLSSTSAGLSVNPRISQWLGFYATWEGMIAQLAALLVVYGSYAVARAVQTRRRRRAMLIAPVLAED